MRLAALWIALAVGLSAESAWHEYRDPETGACVASGIDSRWELRHPVRPRLETIPRRHGDRSVRAAGR